MTDELRAGSSSSAVGSHSFFKAPFVTDSDLLEIALLFATRCMEHPRILGGLPNVTFKALTDRGPLAIRVCNDDYTSRQHVDYEVAALLHLREAGFIQCPQVLPALNGSYVETWRGYPVIGMSFVSGGVVSANCAPEVLVSIGEMVGDLTRALADFHPDVGLELSYRARGERLLSRMRETAHLINWPIDVDFLQEVWDRESDVLLRGLSPTGMASCHTDVWPQNVIRTREGVTLIDFDDLALANPLLDLASAIAEFVVDDDGRADTTATVALIRGFLKTRQSLVESDLDEILAGVLTSYISWLACDATHGCTFSYSARYLARLRRLALPEARRDLKSKIARATDRAYEVT